MNLSNLFWAAMDRRDRISKRRTRNIPITESTQYFQSRFHFWRLQCILWPAYFSAIEFTHCFFANEIFHHLSAIVHEVSFFTVFLGLPCLGGYYDYFFSGLPRLFLLSLRGLCLGCKAFLQSDPIFLSSAYLLLSWGAFFRAVFLMCSMIIVYCFFFHKESFCITYTIDVFPIIAVWTHCWTCHPWYYLRRASLLIIEEASEVFIHRMVIVGSVGICWAPDIWSSPSLCLKHQDQLIF